MKSSVIVAGLAALSLAACSTVNPYTNEQQMSRATGSTLIGGVGLILAVPFARRRRG